MAVQAGVIGGAQITSPSATLSNATTGGNNGNSPGNNPAGWAWFWFLASLLFLVFTHLSHRGRG
jgi:hypothetical protein